MSDTPWLDKIISYIGTREDHNNPVVLRFFKEAGHPEIKSTSVAWCAAIVGAVLAEAGYKNTGSLAARSYEKYGTKLDKPKPGAIAVFARGGKNSGLGHVGIVEKVIGNSIQIVSGNDNDMVRRSTRPTDSAIALRWPIPVTAPKAAVEPKPIVKSKIAQGSATIGTAETVDVGVQINDALDKVTQAKNASDSLGLTDEIVKTLQVLMHNPRFWIALAIVVICIGIGYWRWRDHKQGQ